MKRGPFPLRPILIAKWRTNMPHARHVDLGGGGQNLVTYPGPERYEIRIVADTVLCASSGRYCVCPSQDLSKDRDVRLPLRDFHFFSAQAV